MTGKPRYTAPRTRRRWTATEKAEVADKARKLRDAGLSWRAIAKRLGTEAENVRRWCAGLNGALGPAAGAFVPVVVAGPFASTAVPGSTLEEPEKIGSSAVLVTPGGYRVEGLDLAAVAALLRNLP